MMNWPDNKRIAVMMAFDLDAETRWTTHGDGSTAHMTNLPGVVAEHYPEVVKEIARRGHDIGFHGYLHEESTKTTYEQEDATMHRSEKIIYDLTGQKIAGHRAPGGVIHDYSLRLFLEHGYIYSSNWRDSDGPFLHQIDGKTVPLVELPKDSIFDDTAYDFYTDAAPERYGLKSPDEMFEIWKEEFDSLAVEGRMINFVLHPQFVGRASRVQMLSRLIGYMKSHGAWLDTNRAVASWVLKENGFQVPDHE